MTDAEKLVKLWRSRNTMLEVLIDRKYPVDEENFLDLEEFEDWAADDDEPTIRDAMKLTFEKPGIEFSKIMVIWPKEPKLGVNLREICGDLEENNCTRAIMVTDSGVTHTGKSMIKNLRAANVYIDVYTLIESQFNVTKHRLVPTHVVCDQKEKEELMNSYSISKERIPYIKITDPVVRHYGAVRGQLVKIIRDSETQPGLKSISYRLVQ